MDEQYKIVITRTRTVRKMQRREWQPMLREGEKTHYAYTPEVETLTTETEEIYMQCVDVLFLEDILRAVNKIK